MVRRILRGALTVTAALILGGCVADIPTGSSDASPEQVEVEATSDPGDEYREQGYTELNRYLYSRFLDPEDPDHSGCSYSSGRCSIVEVVAVSGCSRLYVEVNFLNDAGTVLDYSNDTASNIGEGQKVILEFVTFESNATTVEITEASCL